MAISDRLTGDGRQGLSLSTPGFDRLLALWAPAIAYFYTTLGASIVETARSGGRLPAEVAYDPFLITDNINVASAEADGVNQAFWVGLFFLTAFAARKFLPEVARFLRSPSTIAITAFLAFAAVSITWSEAPGIAFRRLVLQVMIVSIFVLSFAVWDDWRALLRRLSLMAALAIWVNLFLVFATAPTPLGHAGFYSHKNTLGSVAALSIIFCLYGATATRGWTRLAMAGAVPAGAYILYMTDSATSTGLVAICPVLAAALIGLRNAFGVSVFATTLLLGFLSLTGFIFLYNLAGVGLPEISQAIFGDPTFTGRTTIWEFVVLNIEQHPIGGVGFGSFWGVGYDSIAFRDAPGFVSRYVQGHNGYLDLVVQTGFVGFMLLGFVVLSLLGDAGYLASRVRGAAWLVLSLLFFVGFHNMLESSWFRGYLLPWQSWLLATAVATAARRTAPPAPRR